MVVSSGAATAASRAAATSGAGFRPDIQGLRGLAVLLVVLFHTGGLLPGGFVGVDVFFVLSGFLIGGILYRQAVAEGRIDLQRFFTRRARRLLPALGLTTTVTVVLALLILDLGGPLAVTSATGVAVSLFAANVHLYRAADYFAPAAELNPLLHTWSLSVEEQFYFVLPVLVALVAWRTRSSPIRQRRLAVWMVLLLVVATVLSFGLNWLLVDSRLGFGPLPDPIRFAFYAPVTRIWEFGAGVLLALWTTHRGAATGGVVGRLAPYAGLGALAYASISFSEATPFPGIAAMVPVVGTVALIYGGDREEWLPEQFRSRPLVWLGDISYSWYLWHWPLIVFAGVLWPGSTAGAIIAATVSLLPAWLSYRFVEQRFRRDQTLAGRRVVAMAAIAILVPVVASLGVRVVNAEIQDTLGVERLNIARSLGCLYETFQEQEWDEEKCLLMLHGPDAPLILLVGDSHANSLSDGAAIAAEEAGANLAISSWNGASFISSEERHVPPGRTDHVERTFDLIERLQPDILVITNRAYQVTAGWTADVEPLGGRYDYHPSALAAWTHDVDATLERLEPGGTSVVWTQVVPEFPGARGPGLLRPAPVMELPLDVVEARRGPALDAEMAAINRRTNTTVFDPVPHLCSNGVCANHVDGIQIYRDVGHLNPDGSSLLAPALADLFADLIEKRDETSP